MRPREPMVRSGRITCTMRCGLGVRAEPRAWYRRAPAPAGSCQRTESPHATGPPPDSIHALSLYLWRASVGPSLAPLGHRRSALSRRSFETADLSEVARKVGLAPTESSNIRHPPVLSASPTRAKGHNGTTLPEQR